MFSLYVNKTIIMKFLFKKRTNLNSRLGVASVLILLKNGFILRNICKIQYVGV